MSSSSSLPLGNNHGAANANLDSTLPPTALEAAALLPPPAMEDACLPFLVTQWLQHYSNLQTNSNAMNATAPSSISDNNSDDNDAAAVRRRDALQRIQRASADLASAFGSLGVFGNMVPPRLLESDPHETAIATVNATYGDYRRRWGNACPPSRLVDLVRAAAASGPLQEAAAADERACTSMVARRQVALQQQQRHSNAGGGRTLDEAIVVEAPEEQSAVVAHQPSTLSVLQQPAALVPWPQSASIDRHSSNATTASTTRYVSCSRAAEATCAASVRRFLACRETVHKTETQIRSLETSVAFQKRSLQDYQQQQAAAVAAATSHAWSENALADLELGQQECHRVICQLERRLESLHRNLSAERLELSQAQERSVRDFGVLQDLQSFTTLPPRNKQVVLRHVLSRSYGNSRVPPRRVAAICQQQHAPSPKETSQAVLTTRLGPTGPTMNTHLHYPVYCLRFDRTGRYFITGADDFLVRVFDVAPPMRNGNHANGNAANGNKNGVVLVCTLKGHAGVINDIQVSSDNAFLATASEDGDCRVWGLSDGCPVAILRGHAGGANMVAWSALTPYHLVTTGADGLARTWDIRQACLKRYGRLVGNRPEYHLQDEESTVTATRGVDSDRAIAPLDLSDNNEDAEQETQAPAVPPLPPPPPAVADAANPLPPVEPAIPLPPLPPAAAGVDDDPVVPLQQQQAGNQALDPDHEPGDFVANDLMDEGVVLQSKLQHGASIQEQLGGPGTRARRAPVKVICVAACPHGGHFATGSDDGICRIFQDEDDSVTERIDAKYLRNNHNSSSSSSRMPVRTGDTTTRSSKLLLTLKGHLSAVTDLLYSHAGDRIVTASQRDGVVRIWSWKADPCTLRTTVLSADGTPPHGYLSHILIKLTNPNHRARTTTSSTASSLLPSSRRRPQRNAASANVSCDVAIWTHDDSKILTSQCELLRQTGSDIVAGSQFLFVWDAANGSCLMGFAAHAMQCPVVIPHPQHAALCCSAGADGVVQLWNLETGQTVYSHTNTVDYGPVEPREKGKRAGYLDGAFSPDGTMLVLTDDSGRVTVLDAHVPAGTVRQDGPVWMKEQYFANDYYELYYDETGYCMERGSEQPPYLAPRGVRCSHAGAPLSSRIDEAYKNLVGPLPLSDDVARWKRQATRQRAVRALAAASRVLGRGVVSQYDPDTTILVGMDKQEVGLAVQAAPRRAPLSQPREESEGANGGNGNGSASRMSNFSSNFRWRDYTDMLREEGNVDDEPDPDDEEFELVERSNSNRRAARDSLGGMDSDSDDLDDYEMEEESPARGGRFGRRRAQEDADGHDSSDGEEMLEFMSTNNTPSGPFVADYDLHLFRLTTHARAERLRRNWVRRLESNSSYSGRKTYSPQVGDAVIYIPRCHYDTLAELPGLGVPPWQTWPQEAEWPIAKCLVKSLRYRFPLRQGRANDWWNQSVAIVLTLEITGIPELSSDREYPWPIASFVEPTQSHMFELCLFENVPAEYIVPFGLYSSRLSRLEDALNERGFDVPIKTFFSDEAGVEDSELIGYPCRIGPGSGDNVQVFERNLAGSGYRAININYEDGSPEHLSPWEVVVVATDAAIPEEIPNRPSLSAEEQARVRSAMASVRSMPGVDASFLEPVDDSQFTDYPSRIEVPMNLSFVSTRLEANYYGSRFSVVSDLRLIRDNCVKYNGQGDELSHLATEMLTKFEDALLDDAERTAWRESEQPLVGIVIQPDPARGHALAAAAASNLNGRSARRLVPVESRAIRASRRSRQDDASNLESLTRRQTLEQLSSNNRRSARARGRSLQEDTRRATRSTRSVGPLAAAAESPLVRATRNSVALQRGAARNNNNNNHVNGSNATLPVAAARGMASRQQDEAVPAEAETPRARTRNGSSRLRNDDDDDDVEPFSSAAESEESDASEHQQPAPKRPRRLHRDSLDEESDHSEHDDDAAAAARPRRGASGNTRRGTRTRTSAAVQESTEGSGDSDEEEEEERSLSAKRRANGQRRRTTRTRGSVQESTEDSGDSEDDEEEHAPLPKRRSNGQLRRTTRTRASAPESDEESENSEEEKMPAVPSRRRQQRAPILASEESDPPDSSDDDDDEPIGRRGQSAKRPATESSASEELEEDTDDDSLSVAQRQPARPARGKPKRSSPARKPKRSAPARADPPGRKRARGEEEPSGRASRRKSEVSYTVPSSSEFESDGDEEPTRRRAATKKRAGGVKKEPAAASEPVDMKPWPDIDLKQISAVADGILERYDTIDEDDLFAVPVAEAYPEVAKPYKALIKKPMDLRTIREDRVIRYTSIKQLQDDLSLMFTNCIKFNGPNHDLSLFARSCLEQMQDVFKQVCEEQNVLLPRRWS